MKAKVYIPIIIAAGAATGLALGFINTGSGKEKNPDELQTEIANETTLSQEELAKQDAQKEKEYEDKVKKEEENAEKFFKKRLEEKRKKEEEEKKKAEEEKRKESEKATEENTENTDNTESAQQDKEDYLSDSDAGDDYEYDYIYVPVDNNSGSSYGNSENMYAAPTAQVTEATGHTHSWTAIYRTVHHNAQTHDEKKELGTVEYTECLYNEELYFTLTVEYTESSFYQVCKLANGDIVSETNEENEKKEISYFMDLMNISSEDEAFTFTTKIDEITDDITVTDKEAYDEEVFDHYICTGCGQTRY